MQDLSLSSLDRETLQTFKANPNGRVFLAITEILHKHGFEDDALQLLMQGVQQHPTYSAARVVLAKRLFKSSIFQEAWEILDQSPVSLRENKTAQILKFRLALLLGYEEKLVFLRQDMDVRGQLDGALRQLNDELKAKSFQDVRQAFLEVARAEGYELGELNTPKVATDQFSENPSSGTLTEEPDPVLLDRLIEGFYVAPVSEIFSKLDEEATPDPDKHDLDAVTLAQVYRKQGCFQKALEIYQRLLYMAPNNDLFKKQVEELKSLRDEQHRQEQHIDPDLVERLDQVQKVDAKISALNRLLVKLEDYEAQRDT
ncbi:tetratricopeptide repeat protein [Pseudobacteriovorax antillogorgiicola]|nr:tetratricopeptide repeat protein [Pseudobacteriovorax antillogorgiicola]